MARHLVHHERVQKLLREKLIPLFLKLGSVNALCGFLNQALGGEAIYPNRLHTLLSDDPTRSLNDGPLGLIERAAGMVDPRTVPDRPEREAKERGDVRRFWMSSMRAPGNILTVAGQIGFPPAVVRHILDQEKLLTSGASAVGGGSFAPIPAERRKGHKPDWSFQEVAVRKCTEALRTAGRKVGLVIPTGGGKTRTALMIALLTLKEDVTGKGRILWVTHRLNLHQQAHRELQRMLTEGPLPMPEDAARLLAERVEFLMLSKLEGRLVKTDDLLLVIVDEAHHAAAPSYLPIFEANPSLPMLALTATPNRMDGLPIGIDEIAFHITYKELVDRGVILMPEFEDFPVLDFEWNEKAVEELADYVIEESRNRFQKTLVIVSRVSRVEEFYTALRKRLGQASGHPLNLDDIGFLHAEHNSMGVSAEDFLAAFATKPRGIIVSAQMLLEGFDDPLVNAVVVTHPSNSLVMLMQAAGRCVRYAPGKTAAYVVQARNPGLAYYFDRRWLYQEISDELRPELVDLRYRDPEQLRGLVEQMLRDHHVDEENAGKVMETLRTVLPGQTCRLLFFGLPYSGAVEEFKEKAPWGAFLEVPSNSEAFRFIFNQFCSSLGSDLQDLEPFLARAGRNYGLRKDLDGMTDWFLYSNMLESMRAAEKEIRGYGEAGPFDGSRPYVRNQSTTWLTYASFHYDPQVPADLEAFLADCYNREETIAQYSVGAQPWVLAIKIPVPLGGMEAHLFDQVRADNFRGLVEALRETLKPVEPKGRFGALAAAVARREALTLPLHVIARVEHFLALTGYDSWTLALSRPEIPPTLDVSKPE